MTIEIKARESRIHLSVDRLLILITARTIGQVKLNSEKLDDGEEIELSIDLRSIQYREDVPSIADFLTIMAAAQNLDADVCYIVADNYRYHHSRQDGSKPQRSGIRLNKQFQVQEIIVTLDPKKGPVSVYTLDVRDLRRMRMT